MIRELASLPNREGFAFIGVLRDGSTRELAVERGADGLHFVAPRGVFQQLVGWKSK